MACNLSIIQHCTDERKSQLIWFTKTDYIFSQETTLWWKGHNNRIWFKKKDAVMMELDRISVVRRVQIEKLNVLIYSSLLQWRYHAIHNGGAEVVQFGQCLHHSRDCPCSSWWNLEVNGEPADLVKIKRLLAFTRCRNVILTECNDR